MSEEDTAASHKALIDAFTKALTNVKVSPTDVLKPPKFDWNSQDQFEDFRLFRKGMESWYKLQNIPEAEGDDTRLEYLLNFVGPIGRKKHKQWNPDGATAATRERKKKSASEFMKFLHEGMDHPVSQRCRIYQLEEIRIRAGEFPDELVEWIRGLADRCDFPTQAEKEQHIQFRLVCTLSDRELVKKLLTMKIEATTAEMLATCRTHIAISDNMSSMGLTTNTVNAVQKFPKKSHCRNCTKPHSPGRQNCPVRNSTCSFCHKQGHWVAKCRKAKKSKPGTKRPHNPQQQSGQRKGGGKKADEVGVSEGDPHCDEITIHA